MKQQFEIFTKKLHQLQGQRDLLISQKITADKKAKEFQETYINTLKAREIVTTVAQATQKAIEIHISSLVSMALASVFPDPYTFELRFVSRRNKTEADLIFIKNNNEVGDLLENGGGGVADVASFALRIALWSLKKSRATFLLDEPFKFLHSAIYQQKTSNLLQEISKKLIVQFIIVSDQENIISAADKVINIVNIEGVSKVMSDRDQLAIAITIDNNAILSEQNKPKLKRRKQWEEN